MKRVKSVGGIVTVLAILGALVGCQSPVGGVSAPPRAVTSSGTLIVDKVNGPYKTIAAGLAAATAGQTVQVHAGVYNEAVAFSASGTSSAPIVLAGDPGAIIDGSTGVTAEVLVTIDGKSYVKVQGFEIRNRKKNGTSPVPMGILVTGASAGVEIRNNTVWGIENTNSNGNAHGIAVYGNSSTAITGLVIDSNEVRNCKLGWSESMVVNGNVDGFTVSNNVVHDNNNIGIDFIGFEGTSSSNDQARNGVCVGNRVYNISSASNPAYAGELSADGIYVDGGKSIVIERNTVDNCDIGIELASEHKGKATDNITVRNNFVSRSYQGNIQMGGYASNKGKATNLTIVNNTTYQATGGELIVQFNTSTVKVSNNVFVAKSGVGYLVQTGSSNTAISVANNLYYGASTSSPGAWADAQALYANPQLVGAPSNLHLQASSPAKDRGVVVNYGGFDIDGQARVNGVVDLGADEL